MINALFLAPGCSSSVREIQPVDPLASLSRRTINIDQIPVAPWMVWRKSAEPDPVMAAADILASRGELEEAMIRYQDLFSRSELRAVRLELVGRELGTMLQMGQSQRVLERASQFLKEENYQLEDSPSVVSLMVGYAYLHQRNQDQSIAWFAKCISSRDPGAYSAQAKVALEQLIQSLPSSQLEQHEQRWRADLVVGRLFSRERIRRGQGAGGEPPLSQALFTPETYRSQLPAVVGLQGARDSLTEETLEVAEAGLLPPTFQAQRKLGVLLPLSGQFAEHALKVKHGIELAAETASPPIEVLVVDTQGDAVLAEQGYISLVQQGAAVVLGPLLVRTTEQVAARTSEYNVPIISFTKRTGIPQLGPAVFRLGVTVENQIDELLRYSVDELGLRRFAVLYPEVEGASEYAYYFRTAARNAGVSVVAEQQYYPGDQSSIQRAVSAVAVGNPEAIFIPDRLDSAQPLFEAIDGSPSAEAVLLGPALWDDPVAIRGFGQLLEGAVFVTPYFSSSPAPDNQGFAESYRKRFEHSPELLAAQGYDAAQIAIAGIDSNRSSGSAVQALSLLPDQEGITGRLRMAPEGEIYRRMSVVRLFRGEVIEVMARGVATGFSPDSVSSVRPAPAQSHSSSSSPASSVGSTESDSAAPAQPTTPAGKGPVSSAVTPSGLPAAAVADSTQSTSSLDAELDETSRPKSQIGEERYLEPTTPSEADVR